MTNTGKLLIIGMLVIDAGVAGYLLFPKDEERAPTASGVVVGSIDDASQDARRGSAQVTGGSVMPEVPAKPAAPVAPVTPVTPMRAPENVTMAPPSAPPQAEAQTGPQTGGLPTPSAQSAQSFGGSVPQQPGPSSAGPVAQQPVQSSAGAMPQQPATGSVALSSSLPAAGPVVQQPAPSSANAVVPTPSAPATAAVTAIAPAPSVAPDSSQVATGRIDSAAQLAAQAKPKTQPAAQQKAQPKPGPRIDRTQQPRRYAAEPHPNGSNPVAALLTDQLVRESSKPDPSLPMPSGISVPSLETQAPVGRSSNPVASAMTEQLVRESSKVAPIQRQPMQQPPILQH